MVCVLLPARCVAGGTSGRLGHRSVLTAFGVLELPLALGFDVVVGGCCWAPIRVAFRVASGHCSGGLEGDFLSLSSLGAAAASAHRAPRVALVVVVGGWSRRGVRCRPGNFSPRGNFRGCWVGRLAVPGDARIFPRGEFSRGQRGPSRPPVTGVCWSPVTGVCWSGGSRRGNFDSVGRAGLLSGSTLEVVASARLLPHGRDRGGLGRPGSAGPGRSPDQVILSGNLLSLLCCQNS